MDKKITIGDKYGPAMKITTQTEADTYFEVCVDHTMGFGKSRAEAENIERQNLGYYAGYYDNETRERVEHLFRCAHPIFGAIAEQGPPSAEEAFRKGLEMGKSIRDRAKAKREATEPCPISGEPCRLGPDGLCPCERVIGGDAQ